MPQPQVAAVFWYILIFVAGTVGLIALAFSFTSSAQNLYAVTCRIHDLVLCCLIVLCAYVTCRAIDRLNR